MNAKAITAPLRPAGRIAILIAAMGGQGGGVLTDWIVAAARAAGFLTQATSIPGVSQRTGATTYYVEMARAGADGEGVVLGLAPMPARVDVLVCAELLEAGRMLERGFCTPSRTLVVASTHRVYTTREKMSAGDARFEAARVVAALQTLSAGAVLLDMEALSQRRGAAISAALFGALAGSGALPTTREACEEAIRASGKGVAASLLAFGDAFERAGNDTTAANAAPPAAAATTGGSAPARGAETGAGFTRDAHVPRALGTRIVALPAPVAGFARTGVAELLDYQDADYAATYLARVERVAAIDAAPYAVARECARFLALWMRYDDLIRVASRKARQARFAGIRAEAGAERDDVVRVYDFFRPGALEVAAILPRRIGAWLEARTLARRRRPPAGIRRRTGIALHANSIGGALALRALASLRPMRPHSLRFVREQQAIAAWQDTVVEALQSGRREAALDLAKLPRLIRGYGDTHAGGRASFERILAGYRDASRQDPRPLLARCERTRTPRSTGRHALLRRTPGLPRNQSQHRLQRDRAERGLRHVVDLGLDCEERLRDGRRFVARRRPRRTADILETGNDVHQREPSGIAGEAITAADTAHRFDDSGAGELGQHLRQMVDGHSMACGDLRRRQMPAGVGGELDDAVERQRRVLLQLHAAPRMPACAPSRRSRSRHVIDVHFERYERRRPSCPGCEKTTGSQCCRGRAACGAW